MTMQITTIIGDQLELEQNPVRVLLTCFGCNILVDVDPPSRCSQGDGHLSFNDN
jgi:hypothetical protein